MNTTFRDLASETSIWMHICKRDFRVKPSHPAFAKRFYQNYSNLKKGKFLSNFKRFGEFTTVALLGKKIRGFRENQNQIALQNPDGNFTLLPLPPDISTTEGTAATWNGKQLATLTGESPSLLIWENRQGSLTLSQTLQVSLPDYNFIRFQWEEKQLLTLSTEDGDYSGEIIFQTWKPGPDRNLELDFSMTLPYPGEDLVLDLEEDYTCEVLAWDGAYLAILHVGSIDIWKKNKKGTLEKIVTGKKQECFFSSLKWNGKFLFAGDLNGNVTIYNRETGFKQRIVCQTFSGEREAEKWYIYDFVFRGNLVFISSTFPGNGSILTICEQAEDGSCKKLHLTTLIDDYAEIQTVVNDHAIFFIAARNFLHEMKFGVSYDAIAKELVNNLKK